MERSRQLRQNTNSHEDFVVVEPVGRLMGPPRNENSFETLALNDGGPPKTAGVVVFPKAGDVKVVVPEEPPNRDALVVLPKSEAVVVVVVVVELDVPPNSVELLLASDVDSEQSIDQASQGM